MESFDQRWKLEKHMTTHQEADVYICDICSKTFYIEWRLNKHLEIHETTSKKKWHYFNNDKVCPYSDVGCTFLHEFSEECRLKSKSLRNLCPFQHSEKICTVCESEFKIESGQKRFKCCECDKFACQTCAKETYISDEY